jgi:hypothetical protein
MDAAHNAGQLSAEAKKARDLATSQQQQAASGYTQIGQYGTNDKQFSSDNLYPMLQEFYNSLSEYLPGYKGSFGTTLDAYGNATGVNTAGMNPYAGGSGSAGGTVNGAGGGASAAGGGSLARPGGLTPPQDIAVPGGPTLAQQTAAKVTPGSGVLPGQTGGMTASSALTGGRPTPGVGGNAAPSAAPSTAPATAPASAPANAPQGIYDLTPAQQEQSNAQVDQVNKTMQSAIADYTASAAQNGMAPNPAMISQIQDHYTAAAQDVKANFAEQARKTRADATAKLLDMFNSLTSTAIGTKQTGLQNLASMFNQIGQQGVGEVGTAASGMGNLSNASNNNASNLSQQAAQQQAQANAAFGDIIKTIIFGVNGGFSGLGGQGADAAAPTGAGWNGELPASGSYSTPPWITATPTFNPPNGAL